MKRTVSIILMCLLLVTFTHAQTASNSEKPSENSSSSVKKKKVIFRATKAQITQVQTILKGKGTFSGEMDGKFSKDFRSAIKDFQGANGLKKTGTLNRATLEKFGIDLTDKQKEYPVNPNSYDTLKNDKADKPKKKRAKSFRPTKKQITSAQTNLKNASSFDGEITGRYSKDFRNSLKAFQEANSLKKTGKLDKPTLDKMGIALTKRQLGVKTDSGKSRRRSFRVNKDQISQTQTMLKEKGLYSGDVTGKYSKRFRKAVKEFQSANGLKRKGRLNRATLEKMGIELTDKQKEIPVRQKDFASVKTKSDSSGKPKRRIFRANKGQIVEVQKMLTEKGLYDGEETGKLNPATRSAIREWQSQNNVKKTGTLNKATLEAMKIALTDKQKEF